MIIFETKKIALIILNWNKSDLTISFVNNIKRVEDQDLNIRMIVVDNKSNEKEREKLFNLTHCSPTWLILTENDLDNKKVLNNKDSNILLLLNENYGYAKGNNYGLKLAHNLGYKYSIISNNDIIIEKPVINDLIKVFAISDNVAIVGPKIIGPSGKNQGPFNKPNLYNYFFYPILYPITWPIEKIKEKLKGNKDSVLIQFPYRLMGCFMAVDLDVMNSVNWFDENTFLYGEELILAEKLNKMGYKTAYIDSVHVKHLHGVSTADLGEKNRIIQQLKSDLYYFKNYRNYGSIRLFFIKTGYLYSNFVLSPVIKKMKEWLRLN